MDLSVAGGLGDLLGGLLGSGQQTEKGIILTGIIRQDVLLSDRYVYSEEKKLNFFPLFLFYIKRKDFF